MRNQIIREQIMDEKFESYTDLDIYLKNLPMTWYPALIVGMVQTAYEKKVFVPGGASRLVKNQETRLGIVGEKTVTLTRKEFLARCEGLDSYVVKDIENDLFGKDT